MAIAQAVEPNPRKPIRLWPGVLIVVLQWLARFVVPAVFAETELFAGLSKIMFFELLSELVTGLAILVWWLFFSRVPRFERWGAVALIAAALTATRLFLHPSVRSGMMGVMFPMFAIPLLSLALVVGAVASRHLSRGARRAVTVASILLACGVWALVRTGGITTEADSDFAWRWSETPEERLVAEAGDEPAAVPPASRAAEAPADWPGFRGPNRDGIVRGVPIATNWTASPPVELWRKPIGPAWSSFALQGGRFYTQEQRTDDEVVSCYEVTTGKPVWRHRNATRFWESIAGAGPRGTPTVSGDRVYTFGATGIVNALDAADGALLWSHDAAADTGAKLPTWGFSSSPLVLGELVVVAASGKLIAYDRASGDRRWLGPAGHTGYSSPHLATIGGVEQILQLNGDGLAGVAPADGTPLWQHAWPGCPIVQPALTADGDVLISVDSGSGLRRLAVAHGPGGWTTEERWTSIGLKPYFNDFVVHEGHAYGIDGSMLASIDLADGKRKWKGGRYGSGQLVLLPDQDLLLVLSEKGELALVAAAPDQFTELARFPAIEGKTWNHPVLAGDLLLVRNGQEMVAFRLALAGQP